MRAVTTVAVTGMFVSTFAFAVGGGKAVYVGGTLAVKEKTEAPIDLKGQDSLTFSPKTGAVQIPWSAIDEAEYGQKVGHRIKTAILLSPIALFSKSRHHYVTFSWKDAEGHEQAAVFEFDKGEIRTDLAIIKARTGKEITYQDDEARKQMGAAAASKAPAQPAAAPAAPVPVGDPAAPAPAASPETQPSPQP